TDVRCLRAVQPDPRGETAPPGASGGRDTEDRQCILSAPSMPAKPVLLTVDDDASVSQALTRDLRRQYAQRFRVVRAESGRQALEMLRELRLADEEVAILLADHRMPGMTGIEFLEQ